MHLSKYKLNVMFDDQDLLNGDGRRESCEKNLGECISYFLPRAAFELLSIIKATICQTLGGTSISGAVSLIPTSEEEDESGFLAEKDLETCDLCTEPYPMTELQPTEDKISHPEVIRIQDKNDFPFSLDSNNSNQFKQFDIIESCCDHHFFDEGKGLSISQVRNPSSLTITCYYIDILG